MAVTDSPPNSRALPIPGGELRVWWGPGASSCYLRPYTGGTPTAAAIVLTEAQVGTLGMLIREARSAPWSS